MAMPRDNSPHRPTRNTGARYKSNSQKLAVHAAITGNIITVLMFNTFLQAWPTKTAIKIEQHTPIRDKIK
jgi:hypothetical protein